MQVAVFVMLSVSQEVVGSPSSANEAGLGVGTSAEVQYEETDDGHGLVPTPHRLARFPPSGPVKPLLQMQSERSLLA